MMDHETWRRDLLSVIRDLADESYQERVWVRGEGPEVDSLTETICRFFDDFDANGLLRTSALSTSQREKLRDLRNALDPFLTKSQGDDRLAIRGAEWQNVRRCAAAAFRSLSGDSSMTLPETTARRLS